MSLLLGVTKLGQLRNRLDRGRNRLDQASTKMCQKCDVARSYEKLSPDANRRASGLGKRSAARLGERDERGAAHEGLLMRVHLARRNQLQQCRSHPPRRRVRRGAGHEAALGVAARKLRWKVCQLEKPPDGSDIEKNSVETARALVSIRARGRCATAAEVVRTGCRW